MNGKPHLLALTAAALLACGLLRGVGPGTPPVAAGPVWHDQPGEGTLHAPRRVRVALPAPADAATPERKALGSVPATPPRPAGPLRLLRWPDRQPLAQVPVRIHDLRLRSAIDTVTLASGHVPLEDWCYDVVPQAHDRVLMVRANGYETQRLTVPAATARGRDHVVLLRPTRGWYGRVVDGKGAPFVYCGPVQFIDWEGDQPITVRWKLSEPVLESRWAILQPPDLEG